MNKKQEFEEFDFKSLSSKIALALHGIGVIGFVMTREKN